MSDPERESWLVVLARLDAALEELSVLRRQVSELTSDRDTWRSRTGF